MRIENENVNETGQLRSSEDSGLWKGPSARGGAQPGATGRLLWPAVLL